MTMCKARTRYGLLAVLLGAALMLAGCGGDDGVAQGTHDMALQELEDAQAAAEAAEQARMDAEAAKEAAEEEAAEAMEDAEAAAEGEMDAEADADAAEEAQMDAEEDAAAAEAAAEEERKKAEAAEAARMKQEQDAAKALMDVQTAAAAAAMAAKTASDAAAMDAMTATTATANIATLQTDEMSMAMSMAAKTAADGAMKAYMAAKMHSEAAAEADDVVAATTHRDMAVAEQANAEKYAKTAMEKSAGAVKYAKMEVMINGTMKSVDDSSIDATMGLLTVTADDDSVTKTGLVDKVMRMSAGKVDGKAFAPRASATGKDTPYQQAVAADNIEIGKVLDTTDDKARLRLVTSRVGVKKVRVYVLSTATDSTAAAAFNVPDTPEDFVLRTLNGVTKQTDTIANAEAATTPAAFAALTDATIKPVPVGMHYKALDVDVEADGTYAAIPAADTDTDGTTTATEFGDNLTVLDHTDLVRKNPATKKYDTAQVYSYTSGSNKYYVVEVAKRTSALGTIIQYQHVDTMAPAAADDFDSDANPQPVPIRASIPDAEDYEHLHFGVWTNLKAVAAADRATGDQHLAGLGIAFVQSIGDGVTKTQLAGDAEFKGDWIGTVRAADNEKLFKPANGAATLSVDFDTDEFEGVLTGLATLTGSLSGNSFSGTKAAGIEHAELDGTAAFKGTFSGGIYGPEGEEAGGIFDFESEAGGAFRGAMGGARDTD